MRYILNNYYAKDPLEYIRIVDVPDRLPRGDVFETLTAIQFFYEAQVDEHSNPTLDSVIAVCEQFFGWTKCNTDRADLQGLLENKLAYVQEVSYQGETCLYVELDYIRERLCGPGQPQRLWNARLDRKWMPEILEILQPAVSTIRYVLNDVYSKNYQDACLVVETDAGYSQREAQEIVAAILNLHLERVDVHTTPKVEVVAAVLETYFGFRQVDKQKIQTELSYLLVQVGEDDDRYLIWDGVEYCYLELAQMSNWMEGEKSPKQLQTAWIKPAWVTDIVKMLAKQQTS